MVFDKVSNFRIIWIIYVVVISIFSFYLGCGKKYRRECFLKIRNYVGYIFGL